MKIKIFALLCLLLLAITVSPVVFAAAKNPALPPSTYYGEFSGTVKSLEAWTETGSEGKAQLVLLENKEGGQASFIVDEITQMLTENELKEGAQVTGYFLNNQPMVLIYPPRYHAMLMAVDIPEGQFIKVARFNEELISDDNSLKLNINTKTVIELFSGEAAPADLQLGGLRLAVFYGVSTRSIPAITIPDRIIVLALTDAVPLPIVEAEQARDNMPLKVADKLLADAPPIYLLTDGTVMVPLRAVAEALGYKVGWDKPTVLLDGKSLLNIGEYGSELRDSRTYVPLNFFKEVMKLNNVFVIEGTVEISSREIVE